MRTVVWTHRAQSDLTEIARYISRDSSRAAAKVVARITEAAADLGAIPTGRPARVEGAYEKSLADIHYIIAYAVDQPKGTIAILRIVHTAQSWPHGSWPHD